MANLLQSSQTKATEAPGYYKDYLSGLATGATKMMPGGACAPEYVGEQPLQTKAFQQACQNFGAQQGAITTGKGYLGQAAGEDITGAASPYLKAGTATSPIAAMQPYAQAAQCFTGYEAGMQPIAQATGLSGLAAASPFLGRAAGSGGACISAQYINKATGLDAATAAQNYLAQAAAKGGLCAASPYLTQATTRSPAEMAQDYMNPYLKTAVQSMSDIAQRNLRQNLSPAAVAAAVGSGQFGSQRGAQVLGQIQQQAQQDLNSQIAQMMSQGYGQALQAAGQQQALTAQAGQTAGGLGQQQQALLAQLGQTAGGLTSQQMQNLISAGNVQGTLTQQQQNLLGQLGQTAGGLTNQQAQNLISAGTNLGQLQQGANQISAGLAGTAAQAQQAQNAANLQAAQTAGGLAAQQAAARQAAGLGMGTLASQANAMNLACINALSTLGAQQQTIAQNKELFPMTTLSNLAGIMQGQAIPTSVKTTLCQSPLSAAAALGTAAKGFEKYIPGLTGKDTSTGAVPGGLFNPGGVLPAPGENVSDSFGCCEPIGCCCCCYWGT